MSKTRAEVERDSRNVVLITIAIVVVALGAFFAAPGMMVVAFAVRPFSMSMDRAQLWTFSVVASGLLYVAFRVASADSVRAGRWYLLLCAASAGTFALAKFGVHAAWPDRMFDAFVRGY